MSVPPLPLLALSGCIFDQCSALQVVVMSATLEAEVYANFFLNSQVLHVAGRRFPVQVLYTTEPQPDILDATVTSVLQIHLEQPQGDILVFLCGQDQIEDTAKVHECTSFPLELTTSLLPHHSRCH